MGRSRIILLLLCGATVVETLTWWLPLPPLGGISPYIPLRIALAAGAGALLARSTGLWGTVGLVGLASVIPTVLAWAVAVFSGMAMAIGAGPAVALSFLTWVLVLGVVGGLAGFVVGRRRTPARGAV